MDQFTIKKSESNQDNEFLIDEYQEGSFERIIDDDESISMP